MACVPRNMGVFFSIMLYKIKVGFQSLIGVNAVILKPLLQSNWHCTIFLFFYFQCTVATSATAETASATFQKIEAMQQSRVQDPAGAAFILLFFQSNIYYNFHGKNEQQHNNIGSIPICYYSKQSISILLFYVWAMKVLGRTLITEFVCFLLLPSYIYMGSTK